jgi:hypothetical protein
VAKRSSASTTARRSSVAVALVRFGEVATIALEVGVGKMLRARL